MSPRAQIRHFFTLQGCTAQEAEDLVQEVCLRLCQAGFTPEDAPPAYTKRTCLAVLRDHLRRRYRERERLVSLDDVRGYPAPATGMEEGESFCRSACRC